MTYDEVRGAALTDAANNPLGDLIAGTQLTAQEVYARMAALGYEGTREAITFHYPAEYCYARAQLMVDQMVKMGIPADQIQRFWAFSEAYHLADPTTLGAGLLNPTNSEGSPVGGAGWFYHVSPAVALKEGGFRVIDPSMGLNGPVSPGTWHMHVGTGGGPYARQQTALGSAPINPHTHAPFSGDGYKPFRSPESVALIPHPMTDAVQRMRDVMYLHPLPALS